MGDATRPWWGGMELAPDQAREWQIGPLTLRVARQPLEWRVAWRSSGDALDDRLALAGPLDPDALDALPADWSLHRFALQGARRLRLTPVLADRPVVVRPGVSLHVPSGQEARVYTSTAVWLRLEVKDTLLLEEPTYRMSDTWFGPSTRVGELCYASRTSARLRLELLPRRPARAVTELRMCNRTDRPLQFDRLKLPVPALSLHATPEGLWTQTLTVTWTASGATEVDVGLPPARSAELVCPPRVNDSPNALARAFGAIAR